MFMHRNFFQPEDIIISIEREPVYGFQGIVDKMALHRDPDIVVSRLIQHTDMSESVSIQLGRCTTTEMSKDGKMYITTSN
jgi:hypothetical protein